MGTAVSELVDRFSEQFGGGRELAHVHAPARSEIAGNHTDHEGGHVVAGALDVSIEGVAALNGTMCARVVSAGYEPFPTSPRARTSMSARPAWCAVWRPTSPRPAVRSRVSTF